MKTENRTAARVIPERSGWEMEETMGNDNVCATCLYYVYDDEYEEYLCDMDMDEDEYVRLISDSHYRCPYYRNGDEYKVVRKQM